MKDYTITKMSDHFLLGFQNMEDAIAFKDKMRDSGVYSFFPPEYENEWVLKIEFKYIVEMFEREFL